MENSLKLYQDLKKTNRYYFIIYQLICYSSIDAFINKPTEEEYKIISNKIIEAYLKSDDSDLIKLADTVASNYAGKNFDLEQLKKMSKWDILEM